MSRRLERVNELLKQELAKLIQAGMKDPRLSGMVSVTRVHTAPDLRSADVFVSFFGGEEQEGALAALNGAAGFLRRELAGKVKMKYIPELRIRLDRSLSEGDKVLRILSELEEGDGAGEEEG